MKDKRKNEIPVRTRSWIIPLVTFIVLQLILILIDISPWTPNFRDLDGRIFGRILNSQFFTEWITFYSIPEFNLCAVFFAITLLPYALLNATKAVLSRKKSLG